MKPAAREVTPTRFTRRFAPRAAARSDRPILEGRPTAGAQAREGLYRHALVTADATTAAILAVGVLPLLTAGAPAWLLFAFLPAMVVLSKSLGLYERDELVLKKTTLDEAPVLLQSAALTSLLLWLTLDGTTTVELDASDVLVVWTASVALLIGTRGLARRAARRLSPTERCLVIGEGEGVDVVAEKLQAGRVDAAVVAALYLDRPDEAKAATHPSAFGELVDRHGIHRVIIAPGAGAAVETLDLIRLAKHAGVRVSVLPRMLEVVGSSVEFDHVDGLTMLAVRRFGLSRSSRWLKRGFDLAGTSLLLGIAAPFMLLVAALIKLDSRGPVIFRQTRVGKDGRPFEMLKFRSMIADAEARKDGLRHLNERDVLFKIAADPRITRMGWVLRRTSIDELPQLFNVWRGEMSLVGPRPLVLDEDAQVRGFHRHRLHLLPGMTGDWQILGSARIPMHEMVGIDYLYVASWSLWSDVKILLRTIPHVVGTRGI